MGEKVAQVIVAETGAETTRFPTPEHLASWAGVSPGIRAGRQAVFGPAATRQQLGTGSLRARRRQIPSRRVNGTSMSLPPGLRVGWVESAVPHRGVRPPGRTSTADQ